MGVDYAADDQPVAMPHPNIDATVVVATRNRGGGVLTTLASILANRASRFEVILVDQSTDDATQQTVHGMLDDERFRYLRSSTVGAGRARNLAFSQAQGEFLLVTDDDCTVPVNWITSVTALFRAQPRVGLIFTSVVPGDHDSASGVIPNHAYGRDRLIRSVTGYARSIGMGAGMSIRRSVLSEAGLFDESLGPGSVLLSGEDHDYAIRTLAQGWWVCSKPRSHCQPNRF